MGIRKSTNNLESIIISPEQIYQNKEEYQIQQIESIQIQFLNATILSIRINKFSHIIQTFSFTLHRQIYLTSVRPLIDSAFDGAKVSCFAYGQTGSGKTHTMLGNGQDVRGLYLLATNDIFLLRQKHPEVDVWVSFYEIYCGKLYDLLNEKSLLFAREDAKNNVNIVGLSQSRVASTEHLMQIIQYGMSIRVTSQNSTNADSSRSHAILQIGLKINNKPFGKISFIDLAGSQRAADHADQCERQTRIDGAQINKSLLALKECIRALDQQKNHTPFRGSKLTMVLKDSFTGYCRTVMIGNIAPNSSSSENTLNTLKYADRVKELKKPTARDQAVDLDKFQLLSRELMLPRHDLRAKSLNAKLRSDKFVNVGPNQNVQTGQVQHNFNERSIGGERSVGSNGAVQVGQQGYATKSKPHLLKQLLIGAGSNNAASNKQEHSHSFRGQSMQYMSVNNNNHSLVAGDINSNLPRKSEKPLAAGSGKDIRHSTPTGLKKRSPSPVIDPSSFQRSPHSQKYGLPFLPQQQREPDSQFSSSDKNKRPTKSFGLPLNPTTSDLAALSEKHNAYIQLILDEEEQLLHHHESHINLTVELTKQQIALRDDADRIGSNIQDYLQKLDSVLNQKQNEIGLMRDRIRKMKGHLNEARSIEDQYGRWIRMVGAGQDHDDRPIDDEEEVERLFVG